jgi:importin subunit beta-1
MYDTAMDITQVLIAAQSTNANLRTVAESKLTQFQELDLPNFLLSLSINQA